MHKVKGKSHSVTRQCKHIGEIEVQIHPFLTSSLEGVGGRRHTPGQSPGTHCAGGVMCPKTSVDGYDGGKILAPTRLRTPDRPSRDH
jgi:hypothetical protein